VKELRLAVIGTAGRKEDGPRLHPKEYTLMLDALEYTLEKILTREPLIKSY